MYVVCNRCGHAKKREKIYDPEEIAEKNLRPVPPTCEKCGSRDVQLRD